MFGAHNDKLLAAFADILFNTGLFIDSTLYQSLVFGEKLKQENLALYHAWESYLLFAR